MTDGPLTVTDAAIMAVVLGSAFLALLRGCVREALSVSAWVFSALFTYFTYLVVGNALRGVLGGGWIVHGVFVLALFAGLVVLFTLANQKILEKIQGDKIATWDQIAGFFFGLARGLLLIAILFRAYTLVIGEDTPPDWVADARLYPVVSATSSILKVVAPGPISDADTLDDIGTIVQEKMKKPPADEEKPEESDPEHDGYSEDERRAIDQLVRSKVDPP